MTIMRVKIGISKLKTHINLQNCARVWNALCNKLLPSVGQRLYLHWLWHAVKRLSEETACEQRLSSTLTLFNVKNKQMHTRHRVVVFFFFFQYLSKYTHDFDVQAQACAFY